MHHLNEHYIDGEWVTPGGGKPLDVINPATEKSIGQISLGSGEDVDRAVNAARDANGAYSGWRSSLK